jgi:hypothetical protein
MRLSFFTPCDASQPGAWLNGRDACMHLGLSNSFDRSDTFGHRAMAMRPKLQTDRR